jgi:nitroimidazol reductase NimA-like FMN-containing flavoprotein (pyridoxamine 5'-phosphate oxidase superfamily)
MNTDATRHVEQLSLAECWELLDDTSVGRLAVDIAGQPDIFPVNFIVDGSSLVFRTGAGTKLAGAVLGHHVAFEIDGVRAEDRTVWSVVVKGLAREITNMFERFAVDDLPLYPWIADPKPNFVRIEPQLVTGRRFHVVDTADLDERPSHTTAADDTTRARARATERWNLAVLPDGELPHHRGAPRLHPD